MKPTRYDHPQPTQNRLVQYGALLICGLMLLAAPLQILLVLAGAPGGFVIAAVLIVLLAAPVLMLTAVAPAVTVHDDGLTLHPAVWREREIPWRAITAVKEFPLLPSADEEVNRRLAVGRKNYRPAQGIMLVIPGLPFQYRIAGFFAGERGQPVIALTNRAHADYDSLLRAVLAHTDPTIHDEELVYTHPG